jgi:septum site-determining protein MinC
VSEATVESAVDPETVAAAESAAVVLKGSGRGLEISISGAPTVAAIGETLTALLSEAPGFFAGNQARVATDTVLPIGALSRLEEVAARFDLRIVEVGARKSRELEGSRARFAEGSCGIADEPVAPAAIAEPLPPPPEPIVLEPPPGPRFVIGPVRSGVVLEHPGHIVVIGDVNPGAEIRAEGNIIILGRLRGVAHAGIGHDTGFIIALSLQPQQLRVARLVARADDADRPPGGAEIAYAAGEAIVVERFTGRLPRGLAASI